MSRKLWAKGARLERLVKRRLEERGYFVIRSAGSHGPCDLVALRQEAPTSVRGEGQPNVGPEVLCVEVKSNKRPSRAKARAMLRIPAPSEVWVHRDRAGGWEVYRPGETDLVLLRTEPYVVR